MKKFTALFLFYLLIYSSTFSQDTFSICAIDTITGEVGSAGASCIDENAIAGGCIILSDVHPGVGVIHSQAYWNPNNQNYAGQLMDMGLPPQQIIDSLVAHDVQNNPSIRQYGIVDFVDGEIRNAAWTGSNCDDYKNHIIGPNYTIQGNILLGQQILDSMETHFLAAGGGLACKLMAALQGAKVIGADTRCFDDGTSSLSAFLRVGQPDDPDDDLYLDLNVPSTPFGIDPIDSLQTLLDEWGGCFVSGNGSEKILLKSTVFPNPANNIVNIYIENTFLRKAKIKVINGFGEKIYTKENLSGEFIQIDQKFENGLYYFIISENDKIISRGKFIIGH